MDLAVRAVRHKVSNDRYRFVDGKYDLDLTYVTNNVIAMSFPAKGLESLWRNEAKDVVNMLNEYHKDAFMILNLSEKKWDHPIARGTLLEFGFRDHHAPPLAMLFQMLTTMHCWLSADPKNVVVIHCMGGKGRTGTVIASYLLFCGRFKTSQESLDYFAQVRSSKANGVVQASQRRYVGYVQEVLSTRIPPPPVHLKLVRIIISHAPDWPGAGGSRIVAQVRRVPSHDLLHSSSNTAIQVPMLTRAGQTVKFEFADSNVWVKGDTLIEFHHQSHVNSLNYMFSFYFHTSFIKGNCLFLQVHEIDRLKKVQSLRFEPEIFINLIFEDLGGFLNVNQLQEERQDAIAKEFYTKALALLPPLQTPS